MKKQYVTPALTEFGVVKTLTGASNANNTNKGGSLPDKDNTKR